MQRRLLMGLAGALVGGVLFAAGARAAELQSPASGNRVDQLMGRYNLHTAFDKLGRGASNLFGGWLEIPYNTGRYYNANDSGGSFFTGVAQGVFKGVVRTSVGLYETVTFFLPYPEDYAPILPTLPYFEKRKHRRPLPLE